MAEMDCAQVRDAAAEYALGILPEADARAVSEHVLACPRCRREVGQLRDISDQLMELVPDAEPPLGFDRRVLSAVGIGRPRRHWKPRLVLGAAAAAVAIAAAGATAAALSSGHHRAYRAELAGVLHQGSRDVGTVSLAGNPTWVSMTVHQLSLTGPISCQLETGNGQITTVGTFQVVDGSGWWGALEPAGISHPTEARLVGPNGVVLASAKLSPS